MGWPTPQDYNEALQNPEYCLIRRDQQIYPGRRIRFYVDCEYLREGVQVSRKWYPLLKMAWVNGRTLDHYISESLSGKYATVSLVTLAEKFREMILLMQSDGIAHGDLQHGNILVLANGDLRLVDYDGMYVHILKGLASNELGHRNYQHPKRTADHYGPYLDNFSAWVIYLSLCALAIDASFWGQARGGDDCLLFRRTDLKILRISHTEALEESPLERIEAGQVCKNRVRETCPP